MVQFHSDTWHPLPSFSAAAIHRAIPEDSTLPYWEVHDVALDRYMVTSDLGQFDLPRRDESEVRCLDVGETHSVGGGAAALFCFYRVR